MFVALLLLGVVIGVVPWLARRYPATGVVIFLFGVGLMWYPSTLYAGASNDDLFYGASLPMFQAAGVLVMLTLAYVFIQHLSTLGEERRSDAKVRERNSEGRAQRAAKARARGALDADSEESAA